MKKFSEFGITMERKGFTGEKIKMSGLLNRQIVVHDFKIDDSKFNEGQCLQLQISIGETKRVLFTGSLKLIEMIHKINREDFPFTTTIIEDEKQFLFT